VKSAVKLTIKLESLDEILPLSERQIYGIICKLDNEYLLIRAAKSAVKLTIKLERHDEILPLSK
jgi:hypothetical protein